jgi:Schlafen, AlbA_2
MKLFSARRWHRALFLFTGIFILAVVTQFGVGWYQRYAKALSTLSREAEEISKQLPYSERRNLTQYRQADLGGRSYYVLDSSGLIIDIVGFVPAMKLHVRLDDQPLGLRTVTVPETGETWRLFVKQLGGGIITLGVSPPEDITNIDKRLEENAKRFSSLDEAINVGPSVIDRNLEYTVVDRNGDLRFAIGGIPLKIVSSQRFPSNKVIESPGDDGPIYGVFTIEFRDSLGTGGVISAFEKLDPQPWFVLRHWIVNCLTSAFLAFVGTLIGIPYIGEKFDPLGLLHHSLRQGESSSVEFKESLKWDQGQGTQQISTSEFIAVKTIAALLNNQAGGTLFIGIADDKRIVGLERDYESLRKVGELSSTRDKDRDRFQLHFRHLLAPKIGQEVSNLYIQTAIVEADGKDVCVIHARPAAAPVYLSSGKAKAFYVRDGASTVEYNIEQVVAYVQQRWPKALWRRAWNELRRS